MSWLKSLWSKIFGTKAATSAPVLKPSVPVVISAPSPDAGLPPSPLPEKSFYTGADLSHWESVVSWARLKGVVDFIYTKASQGLTEVDSKVAEYVSKATLMNIPIGVFHVIECDKSTALQVAHFLSVIHTRGGGTCRPALDFETEVNEHVSWPVKKKACLDFIRAVKSATTKKMIFYCNESDFRAFAFTPAELEEFDMWIAAPGLSKCPTLKNAKVFMWQYSFARKTDGIGDKGTCDSDYLYAKLSDLS